MGTFARMATATSLREVLATRYVIALREGGSLPGLVEADDDGLYVVKFRGAGQGPLALVAEVIAGELARQLGLRVPELVRIELDPTLGAAEPDPEIQDLLDASAGRNLGVDFLPGALPFMPGGPFVPAPELAADIVWLDAFLTNVYRTPRNPNLLIWHGQLWLIDHGAALYLQHAGLIPAEHAGRPFPQISDHVLLGHAGSILEAHRRLSTHVNRGVLDRIGGLVPPEWFIGDGPRTISEYLSRRAESGVFAEEAERARRGA